MADQPNADDYLFARDYRASARLDFQHHFWRSEAGYLVHPLIVLPETDAKIADVGTGTGIWATDLARLLPASATVYGLDLITSQCPPRTWLPDNVHMERFNVLGKLREDYIGAFDFVHVRLFMFVVSDPRPMLQNVMRMLKPGGWLQWEEFDNETAHTIKTHDSVSSASFERFFDAINKLGSNTNPLWVADLHSTFREEGLNDVQMFRTSTVPERLPCMTNLLLMAWEELVVGVTDERVMRELKDLLPRAISETRHGLAYDMDRVVTIGRKT